VLEKIIVKTTEDGYVNIFSNLAKLEEDGKKIIITTEEQFNEAGLIMQSELTAVVWVVCAVLVVAGFAAVFALSKMEDKKTSDK
jgi:hypothetical protein